MSLACPTGCSGAVCLKVAYEQQGKGRSLHIRTVSALMDMTSATMPFSAQMRPGSALARQWLLNQIQQVDPSDPLPPFRNSQDAISVDTYEFLSGDSNSRLSNFLLDMADYDLFNSPSVEGLFGDQLHWASNYKMTTWKV